MKKARALMVLGTMSNSGKSTMAAAFCRLAARQGVKVAPFKAQNMSLNSHVTPERGEIGRAQAVQALAAGVDTHTDMNPVLLKPTSAGLMQVIVDGKAIGNLTAREYYSRKTELKQIAHRAYDRLAARFDLIVLEGAGSPAEINLREEDFVNASMGEYAGARCVLVADIDRGGVFASILGTVQLLPERHRKLLAGIIINKFRGDASLLDSGIKEIEHLTGIPVLGVLPFLEDLHLEEEDSLGLAGRTDWAPATLDIAVVRLPYLSNFTDFHPLERIPGVTLRYVSKPNQMGNPDLIFIPGTKNVRHDLEFLRTSGLAKVLSASSVRRIPIFGICGGYQILGLKVSDPHGLEGEAGETPGLGLLPVETVLEREKELSRVEGENLSLPFLPIEARWEGYEIHMGRTTAAGPGRSPIKILRKNGVDCSEASGGITQDSSVFGCYVHGLFDLPSTRNGLLEWLAARKGLEWKSEGTESQIGGRSVFDPLADAVEKHLDIGMLLSP
jgi:adenosylcobyric acid synthase